MTKPKYPKGAATKKVKVPPVGGKKAKAKPAPAPAAKAADPAKPKQGKLFPLGSTERQKMLEEIAALTRRQKDLWAKLKSVTAPIRSEIKEAKDLCDKIAFELDE